MSKLTNHQTLAQIEALERSVMSDVAAGLTNSHAGRRRQQRLTAYKEELAQR